MQPCLCRRFLVRTHSEVQETSTCNFFSLADPSLTATFPNHHGILHIQTLPASHTLLPPSDRFSTVRGLSASGGAAGGSENNITFKSTRKRLVFETLHLDIEGGVGERRTTAPSDKTWELGGEENRESRGNKAMGGREKAVRKVAFQADLYDF